MMKYRIAIQKVDDGYKHIHNIMLESNDEEEVITKVRRVLAPEINHRTQLAAIWANKGCAIKKMIDETPDDLIDWKSKGKDISKEEFLENEIWHERNQS